MTVAVFILVQWYVAILDRNPPSVIYSIILILNEAKLHKDYTKTYSKPLVDRLLVMTLFLHTLFGISPCISLIFVQSAFNLTMT